MTRSHTDLTCDHMSLDTPSYSIIRGSSSRTHKNLRAELFIYFRGSKFGSVARGALSVLRAPCEELGACAW
jgi:hypothetical protein